MASYTQTRAPAKRKTSRKKVIVLIIIVLLLVGGGIFWWHKDHETKTVKLNTGVAKANSNVPASQTKGNNPTTGANSTKGEPGASSSSTVGTPNSKDQGGNEPGTAQSGATPTTPTGDFVSSYQATMTANTQGPSNEETSTCNTSAGVQCTIEFSNGTGTPKKLPIQTTDQNGGTLWTNWTLQSIGLTPGTWKVTAVATNGSKSISSTDVNELVITQ